MTRRIRVTSNVVPPQRGDREDDESIIDSSHASDEDLNLTGYNLLDRASEALDVCLRKHGYLEKHAPSGVFYKIKNEMNCFLHVSTLRKTSDQVCLPEFCNGVVREGTFQSLMAKLSGYEGEIDRSHFNFDSEIRESLVDTLMVSFSKIIRFRELEEDFRTVISAFMGIIVGIVCNRGNPINLKVNSECPYVAWGILAKMVSGVLDDKCGFIGKCDLSLSDKENRVFVAIELKTPGSGYLDLNRKWHELERPWNLQIMNSFIGSGSEIGIALAPQGVYFLWREKVSHETYQYFTVGDPRFFKALETEQDFASLADVFVELVRICARKRQKRGKDAYPVEPIKSAGLSRRSSSVTGSPVVGYVQVALSENVNSRNIPVVERSRQNKDVVLSEIETITGKHLLVGRVDIKKVIYEEDLENIEFDEEDEFENDEYVDQSF